MTTTSFPLCRVLCIYYSFSSQSKNLVQALTAGIEGEGGEVTLEALTPVNSLRFPVGSYSRSLTMMVTTFFRLQTPIMPVAKHCYQEYDLVLLAGPTWSYNPSGPVWSLLQGQDAALFAGRQVIPVISCRSYWRFHYWVVKKRLEQVGGHVNNCMAFCHPGREPWRTVGVFLKLAGRVPEAHPLLSRYYPKFGHTRDQLAEAELFGGLLARTVKAKDDLGRLVFQTAIAGCR